MFFQLISEYVPCAETAAGSRNSVPVGSAVKFKVSWRNTSCFPEWQDILGRSSRIWLLHPIAEKKTEEVNMQTLRKTVRQLRR